MDGSRCWEGRMCIWRDYGERCPHDATRKRAPIKSANNILVFLLLFSILLPSGNIASAHSFIILGYSHLFNAE